MPKLLLLDGHSLAYRAFYALPTDLATHDGHGHERGVRVHVDAREGARRREARLHRASRSTRPGPTFRDDDGPRVQGGPQGDARPLPRRSCPLIREVLDALEIPVLEVEGVEADDVIATLATRAAADGHRRRRRHRRPRLVPARAGPAHQGPLQQARRLRLRALRRGRASSSAPAGHARAVPRVRRAARRHQRQPSRRPRHRREDRGEARHAPTATSRRSSSTSTSCRRSSARTSASAPTACAQNREMSVLRRDVDVGVEPSELQQGAFDREQVRVLFDQLEFRTLLPRMLEALGERPRSTSAGGRRRSTSRSRWSRDADGRASSGSRDRDTAGEPYALEARWGGAAGRERAARACGRRRRPGASRTSTRELLARPAVPRRSRALVARPGPPLVAHRAKELMHGLARRPADARTTTPRSWRTCSIPAEGKYLLEDLALRYLSLELDVARREEGTLDLDGDAGVEETGAGPRSSLRLADALAEALAGARAHRPLRADRAAARPRARKMEARRHPHRPRVPRRARRASSTTSATVCVRRDPRARRRGVQRQLDAAARADAVREARAHAGEEDEDRPVDRRRLAPEDGRGAPDRRGPAAVPRGREAARHLRRRAAAARRRRRAHPRDVQPDRHHDGADLERGTRTSRTSRCAPPTGASSAGRSSPTTGAGCSPPTTRRSSCACSRTSPRTRA